MDFSRQEHWNGLTFPSPEDLPHPGIKPGFPTLQADSLPSEPSEAMLYNTVIEHLLDNIMVVSDQRANYA